ncbi:MAG: GNAT family N-acetyltransferase [Rhodobacteraceae bacterium]|nr:GNAT family N-acetyltransferase [Paracoccaceae bacterium]
MNRIVKGRYSARISNAPADVLAAQRLRASQFCATGPDCTHIAAVDRDRYDDICRHVLVEDLGSGALVACFRVLHLERAILINQSYSAQYYDLDRLLSYPHPVLEVGRFCICADRIDPDIPRIAWALLTRYVDAHQVGLMFGCSSFQGTEMTAYTDAFALLRERYLAPNDYIPLVKSPNVIHYADQLATHSIDRKAASQTMPTLLKTYLAMGGWVSDHAVIDLQLNTLHVFTGVEIANIPPMRKKLLRADVA